MALRWGIASAGRISNDFVSALGGLPKEEHQVVAVAARSLASAEKFAKLHNIPKYYEGYEKLAKDPNVQVVYIGVLNPQHHLVASLMLENGKHVLMEKPFTVKEQLTREVFELAKKKKLFIMEALWTRFFPVFREIRDLLDEGALGEVKFASVAFGFDLTEQDRVQNKDKGGSATLDLGVYILQFQQLVFRGLKPEKVVAIGSVNSQNVDVVASAIFSYPGNKTAVVSCNALLEQTNEAVIIGTKGIIRVPTFWAPVNYYINGELREKPLLKNDGNFVYKNSAGLAYEAIEVRKRILEGSLESPIAPHEESIQLAAWMDYMRNEIGAVDVE